MYNTNNNDNTDNNHNNIETNNNKHIREYVYTNIYI